MKIFKKTIIAIAVLGIASTSALAQSNNYMLSQFEGFYVGAYGGSVLDPDAKWTAGGLAGANFVVTDYVLAGVEMQAGASNLGGALTYDALMLGKVGYEFNDNLMVYGAGGGGLINSVGSYAIGGGAEAILMDNVGVRGELLGTGAWGGGLNATKATIGLTYHLQ